MEMTTGCRFTAKRKSPIEKETSLITWTHLFCILMIVSGIHEVQCSELSSGEQLYNLKILKEYENYGHVALFRFRLPSHVTYAKWYVNKIMNHPDECDDLLINVAIESGSLPVINPYNTSFPENTAKRSDDEALTFTIPKGSNSLILESTRVTPGDWFIVAYRKKENNKIQQAGLSTTCHYFANSMMIYDRLTHIETLGSIGSTSVTLDIPSKNVLYKFYVESNMAAVSFYIEECSGQSAGKSLHHHCPVELFVHANRLPDSDSLSILCLHDTANFTGCSLEVSPATRDTWYYLNVTKYSSDEQLKVDLSITVNATICQAPLSEAIPINPSPPSPPEANADFFSTLLPDPIDFSTLLDTTTITNDLDNVLEMDNTANNLQSNDSDNVLQVNDLVTNTTNMTTAPATPTATPTPTPVPMTSVPLTTPAPTDLTLCPTVDPLSVNYFNGNISKEFFSTQINETEMLYYPSGNGPFIASFKLSDDDIGGVLVLYSNVISMPTPAQNITSTLCLRKDTPPFWNGTSLGCEDHMMISEGIDSNSIASFNYPFPSPGTWYAAHYATCIDRNSLTGQSVPCHANLSIEMRVMMTSCIDNCGPHGRCDVHHQDGVQFYACRCSDDYRGWGCTDDEEVSSSNFLIKVLFVTLSNAVFLIDTFLCLYRHHFPEAVSFLATCFFSTMYHACDSSPVCITDYDTLQFCDFFASFMSILLILIAMARLPRSLKATIHILGVYVLAFFAQWDRFSLWSIAIPLGAGIFILSVSWGLKMYKRRKLYPSVKRWALFIIPGTLLAILGLSVNAALETESNYYIVHSAWHLCMGLGVLLLIPPREKPCKNEYHPMAELVDINALNSELIQNNDPGY